MLTIWYNIFYNRFDSIIPRKIIFDKEITFGYTIFIWNKRSSYIILNNILIMSNPSIIFRYTCNCLNSIFPCVVTIKEDYYFFRIRHKSLKIINK